MAILGILVGAGLPVFTASVLGYQSTTKNLAADSLSNTYPALSAGKCANPAV